MGKYFGTDGFRGEVGVTLLPIHAYKIGHFLGWYIRSLRRERPRFLIARDTRISAGMLEGALCAGLCAAGADAYLLGVAPTPALAYLIKRGGYDFGVMLSASHNPFYDNGIKLFDASGEKPSDALLGLAEDYLDGSLFCFGKAWGTLPMASGEQIGRVQDAREEIEAYIGFLTTLGASIPQGVKIGLDLANGATSRVARAVFSRLGAQLAVLAEAPNGVNINASCGSTHPERLCELVKARGLNIAFAFDGDGDRCIAVDEAGCVVDGDGILYILARHLQKQGRLKGDTVVATILSNGGLAASLARIGITLLRTGVGDRNVWECLRTGGYSLGGEQAGHIILGEYATTGDGILTALALLSALEGGTLTDGLEGFQRLCQETENIPLKRRGFLNSPEMQTIIYNFEQKLGDGGRLVVRESGTEPLLRLMVEGKDPTECHRTIRELMTVLRERG